MELTIHRHGQHWQQDTGSKTQNEDKQNKKHNAENLISLTFSWVVHVLSDYHDLSGQTNNCHPSNLQHAIKYCFISVEPIFVGQPLHDVRNLMYYNIPLSITGTVQQQKTRFLFYNNFALESWNPRFKIPRILLHVCLLYAIYKNSDPRN